MTKLSEVIRGQAGEYLGIHRSPAPTRELHLRRHYPIDKQQRRGADEGTGHPREEPAALR